MFNSVLRRVRGPQPAKQPTYRAGVIAGKPFDDDALEGRNADDVRADFETIEQRREAAAILASADDGAAEVAAAGKAVEAAQRALESHPLNVMFREVEQLRQNLLSAQTQQSAVRGSAGSRKAQATAYLLRTASREIDARVREISSQIEALQRDRNQVALNEHERDEREQAEQTVATAPAQLAKLSGVDAATLTAELVMAKAMLKRFGERDKEVARMDREIGKLETQRVKIEAERLLPENMEFKSRPKVDF